jgi:hypothetical protein
MPEIICGGKSKKMENLSLTSNINLEKNINEIPKETLVYNS